MILYISKVDMTWIENLNTSTILGQVILNYFIVVLKGLWREHLACSHSIGRSPVFIDALDICFFGWPLPFVVNKSCTSSDRKSELLLYLTLQRIHYVMLLEFLFH